MFNRIVNCNWFIFRLILVAFRWVYWFYIIEVVYMYPFTLFEGGKIY